MHNFSKISIFRSLIRTMKCLFQSSLAFCTTLHGPHALFTDATSRDSAPSQAPPTCRCAGQASHFHQKPRAPFRSIRPTSSPLKPNLLALLTTRSTCQSTLTSLLVSQSSSIPAPSLPSEWHRRRFSSWLSAWEWPPPGSSG